MGAPPIIFQIRNFDVPLMVLLSGVSFSQFSANNYLSYRKYVYSRFLRLILPTWIFLIFYNFVNYTYDLKTPTLNDILLQASLFGGSDVGVWIIRIFFSMAIAAPLFYLINRNLKNDKTFYIVTVSAYFVYELSVACSKIFFSQDVLTSIADFAFSTIPYAFVFLYGLRINNFEKDIVKLHSVIFGIVWSVYCVALFIKKGMFVPTQLYKYPPQLYYLSFSLFMSTSLFYIIKFTDIKLDRLKIIQFIGRSTLWIYLWHWFFIKIVSHYQIGHNLFFLYKFTLVYLMSVVLVYWQTVLICFFNDKLVLNEKQSNFFFKVFTG